MELAKAGDIVQLADGVYGEQLFSMAHGTENSPITIIGGEGAMIKTIDSPSIGIYHSHVHLQVRFCRLPCT